jgi:hypothetical protein
MYCPAGYQMNIQNDNVAWKYERTIRNGSMLKVEI